MRTYGWRLLRRLADAVRPDAPLNATMLAVVLMRFCFSAGLMDAIGIHAVLGGFLLGACMPKGALVEKIRETLQPCVVVFFLSMFFTFSGLKASCCSHSCWWLLW